MSDESRGLDKIIEEICTHPENVLKILYSLNDEEHKALTGSELLVQLQRARGLACYDVIAAYCLGTQAERDFSQDLIAKYSNEYFYLKGAFQHEVLENKAIDEYNNAVEEYNKNLNN